MQEVYWRSDFVESNLHARQVTHVDRASNLTFWLISLCATFAESKIENMARTTSKEQNVQSVLMASVLLFLVCLVVIWANISSIRGALLIDPSSYRTTTGTITQSCISYHSGKAAGYNFSINYVYSIGKKDYNGNQITFGARGNHDKSFAESYVRKYPTGRTVIVYYKVDEPFFAVLEPTTIDQTREIFIGILIFSAVCIAGILWSARKLRQLKQEQKN